MACVGSGMCHVLRCVGWSVGSVDLFGGAELFDGKGMDRDWHQLHNPYGLARGLLV